MIKKISKIGSDNLSLIANYLNIGWQLVGPILFGLFIGLYLDRLFKTKPIFLVALILFGAVGSFYNLIKIAKNK